MGGEKYNKGGLRAMTKQDKAKCFERFAMLNDDQLLSEYHEQLLNTLGTQTDRMYELGYSMEDIKEREKFEKEMSEELHLYEECLNKRGIDIWPKPITNRQWLESLTDEELAKRVRADNDLSTMTRADHNLFELCAGAGCLYSREMAVVAWLQAEHKEEN